MQIAFSGVIGAFVSSFPFRGEVWGCAKVKQTIRTGAKIEGWHGNGGHENKYILFIDFIDVLSRYTSKVLCNKEIDADENFKSLFYWCIPFTYFKHNYPNTINEYTFTTYLNRSRTKDNMVCTMFVVSWFPPLLSN